MEEDHRGSGSGAGPAIPNPSAANRQHRLTWTERRHSWLVDSLGSRHRGRVLLLGAGRENRDGHCEAHWGRVCVTQPFGNSHFPPPGYLKAAHLSSSSTTIARFAPRFVSV